MIPVHTAIRIALVQILVVVIGVFTTCGPLKLFDYPHLDVDWNLWAVAVRNWGFLLLLIPAFWAALAIHLENKGTGGWTSRWTLLSGIAILLGLVAFLGWTTLTPYHPHRGPIHSMSS